MLNSFNLWPLLDFVGQSVGHWLEERVIRMISCDKYGESKPVCFIEQANNCEGYGSGIGVSLSLRAE